MKFWQVIFFLFLISCSNNEKKENAIARVNETYLYVADLQNLIPAGTSKQDSLTIVKDYINRWALQQLLLEKADENVSNLSKKEIDELIKQYKTDLYTKAYLEQYVKTKVDTFITNQEIEDYYINNKKKLLTNESLYKLRYVNIEKNSAKTNEINSIFARFNENDKKKLDQLKVYFKKYAVNDSVWVDLNQVYDNIGILTPDNKDKYLSVGKLVTIKDSSSIWFIKVKDVIPKNTVSPLQYIKPTIKQIILNERKTTLINKLEKEITNDAKESNDFEIFK